MMNVRMNLRSRTLPRYIPSPALVVMNQGDASLSVIDPVRNLEVAVIVEGVPSTIGHEVATSPDGRHAYVPLYGNSRLGQPGTNGRLVLVIDLIEQRIVNRVDFTRGLRPHCIVYEPNKGLLYVTTEMENTVSVVDPLSMKVISTIPTRHEQSHRIAIAHDGRMGYTCNVSSGTISVLNLETRTFVKSIPVSSKIQYISISRNDRYVFTADQAQPQVAIISTAQNKVLRPIQLPSVGLGSAATLDSNFLLIALPTLDKVAVINLHTMNLMRTVAVGRQPQEVLICPDHHVAYVSCFGGQEISVIDLSQWRLVARIPVGRKPDGMAWAPAIPRYA